MEINPDKIVNDVNYMEGQWAAKNIVKNIERTTFETIDGAIIAKSTVVKSFEEDFGFHRNMDQFDRNYSYNSGLLDELKKIKNEQDECL